MAFFLILFFIFSIFMTGITTLPFILTGLVLSAIFSRKIAIFLFAFLGGIVLDFSLFRPVGLTSLIFVSFLLSTYLYSRRFEVRTIHFVFFATFLGSLIYLWIFGYQTILLQSLISAFVAVFIFLLIQNSKGKSQKFK